MNIVLILVAVLGIAAGSDLFLGEKHEYGHIPIDTSAPQYSIFYWLFRSRATIPHPPLVVWIEGGPGCSCQQSLFLEHGPYRLLSNSSNFTSSPYSWNNVADILYTDQPIGTGLSNCSNVSRIPTSADEMAADFYGFFTNFLKSHPEYRPESTTIYFAGHSFGGRFTPAIVKLLLAKAFPFRIGGVMLGNPSSDPHALSLAYSTFAYKHGLISSWSHLGSVISRSLYEFFDYLGYNNAALMFYWLARGLAAGILTPHFNQADIRGISMPSAGFEKLMRSQILPALHMESRGWANCNPVIPKQRMAMEYIKDYSGYLEMILNRGIPLVFYYGDKDFICSTDSWEYMHQTFNWPGKEKFSQSPTRHWWVNGYIKGEVKHYDNLWYYKVYDAGHIVFFNEPEAGLDLITKLITLPK